MEKDQISKINTLGLATTMATKRAKVRDLKIIKNKHMATCTINQY